MSWAGWLGGQRRWACLSGGELGGLQRAAVARSAVVAFAFAFALACLPPAAFGSVAREPGIEHPGCAVAYVASAV
jgi:hypothetical protein